MQINLQVINSFSINNTGGNPAGVVLDAGTLSNEQKQLIAYQAGLSETAFVSPSSIADFKLEFFTPTRQIAHCGHATIATFWYLKSLGKIKGEVSSKETIDGTRKIFFKAHEPFMEQLSPKFNHFNDIGEVYSSLGLKFANDKNRFKPVIGNTGNSFILIKVNEISDLARLKPDFDMISRISSTYNVVGYYVYALTPNEERIETRMFAPIYGINEESATGMAAGPLGCLLFPEINKTSFSIYQGKYMVMPSESKLNIHLNTEGEAIKNLLVGGNAFINKTLKIDI